MPKILNWIKIESLAGKVALTGVVLLSTTGGAAAVTHRSYDTSETSPISYETKYVDDDTKLTGVDETAVEGAAGSKVTHYQITTALGIVVSKRELSVVVTKPATTAVIKRGDLDKSVVVEPEVIPFAKQQVNDRDLLVGQYKITQAGSNGTREKTYEVYSVKGSTTTKTMIKNEVATQPVPEITAIGINYRVGATCVDGWPSDATGSGACSHHGGVGDWLYAY